MLSKNTHDEMTCLDIISVVNNHYNQVQEAMNHAVTNWCKTFLRDTNAWRAQVTEGRSVKERRSLSEVKERLLQVGKA